MGIDPGRLCCTSSIDNGHRLSPALLDAAADWRLQPFTWGRAASSGCPATGVLIVCTGETVDGHLQVTAIDAASVKLPDPSTSQETTLLLAKFTEGPS